MKLVTLVGLLAALVVPATCFANQDDENDGKKLPGYSRDALHVVIDESGKPPTANGMVLGGYAGADGNMVWILPEPVFSGDLLLVEPGADGKPGILSDVLRFWDIKGRDQIHDPQDGGNLTNLMSFYSDGEMDDNPVDLGLPFELQHNRFSIVEPANERVLYQAGAACYDITSDGIPNTPDVPEPASLALLGVGIFPLLRKMKRN